MISRSPARTRTHGRSHSLSASSGTATLVLKKGTFSLGGSFRLLRPRGLPQLTAAHGSRSRGMTVTDSGPVWQNSNPTPTPTPRAHSNLDADTNTERYPDGHSETDGRRPRRRRHLGRRPPWPQPPHRQPPRRRRRRPLLRRHLPDRYRDAHPECNSYPDSDAYCYPDALRRCDSDANAQRNSDSDGDPECDADADSDTGSSTATVTPSPTVTTPYSQCHADTELRHQLDGHDVANSDPAPLRDGRALSGEWSLSNHLQRQE